MYNHLLVRYVLVALVFIVNQFSVLAQADDGRNFYKVGNKNTSYYIDLGEKEAKVFRMGRNIDPGRSWNAIVDTDTLVEQTNGIYVGKRTRIKMDESKLILIIKGKREKRLSMDYVQDNAAANRELNNAYFMERYIAMSSEVRDSFLVDRHSFRTGFIEWDRLKNKEQNYISFRMFTDTTIAHYQDSIVSTYNKYKALTNFITLNVRTVDYSVLKDSLAKLPKDDYLRYYWNAVSEIIKRKPEYLYRLVEDFPNDQSDIFFAVNEWDKEHIGQIRAIEGHDAVKKKFVKDIRGRKYMLFHAAGMYTLIIAGVVLLLI